jgi:hypothetical protein
MQHQSRHDIITIFLLVLCFLSPLLTAGQTFNREQIIGVWTSREVSFTNPAGQTPVDNAIADKTKRGLVNAKFIFRSNGLFLLHLPPTAPREFRELESMNNKMWHIRSKERMVFVGSLDENLMAIDIKMVNGFYYFFIQDTPLVLKMERNR